jgi:hypothetical protein
MGARGRNDRNLARSGVGATSTAPYTAAEIEAAQRPLVKQVELVCSVASPLQNQ